ncbi:NOP5/NOP56 family protein [Thermoplasma volcanium]|nr:NOP5/NOP56 family protein [Thermoplasma volcanium]
MGRTPELDGEGKKPDLRSLLIEYGNYRIKQEFTEDQAAIKVAAVREEMDQLINKYYEKCLAFAIPFDLKVTSDPCAYFRQGSTIDGISELFSYGSKMCDFRGQLDERVKEMARQILPNTTALVGERLAMDLLVHAHGLKRLAYMPSSSIQMLGAERALFTAIQKRGNTPKYGVLFKYPKLSTLRPRQRGKIARIIANKVAITARADLLGTKVDAESFREKIDNMIKSSKK